MNKEELFTALESSVVCKEIVIEGRPYSVRELSATEFIEATEVGKTDVAASDALLICFGFEGFDKSDVERVKNLPARITKQMAQGVMEVMGLAGEEAPEK